MIGNLYLPHESVGFAHAAGESLYPHVWSGLKVSAAPCLGIGGRNIIDLSPHRYDFIPQGTATAQSFAASPWGSASIFNGNISWQQSATAGGVVLPCKFCTDSATDEVTLHALFRYVHKGSANEMVLFWSDNPTIGSLLYGYRFYIDANADKLKLQIANGDNDVTTIPARWTSATTLTAGRWYNVVVTFSGENFASFGQSVVMWIDGIFEFPTLSGLESNCLHLSTQHSRIGAVLGSTAPDFALALLNVWNRRLSDSEIHQLFDDSVGMFRIAG